MNVVKRLFKIQNINASTIRTVMVAHCRRHDTPDLLLDYEAQSQARRSQAQAGGQPPQHHQPMLFDLGTTDSEEEDEEGFEELEVEPQVAHLPQAAKYGPLDHVIQVRGVEWRGLGSGQVGRWGILTNPGGFTLPIYVC